MLKKNNVFCRVEAADGRLLGLRYIDSDTKKLTMEHVKQVVNESLDKYPSGIADYPLDIRVGWENEK